jgi:hypothetical protein
MSKVQMEEIRFVAATGAVGAGVAADSLDEAMAQEPHFIAADAGTTDAAPYSLGSGQTAFPREMVKHDLTLMLRAAKTAGIPVLVGSAGTAGETRMSIGRWTSPVKLRQKMAWHSGQQ